jgi:hypothetical protein
MAIALPFLMLACDNGFGADVTLHPSGPPETVFDWSEDRCVDTHYPDAPARAFRDSAGRIHLIASDNEPRFMFGTSLDALEPDCRTVMAPGGDPDPGHVSDQRWISSLLTRGGTHVWALLHHEFQGHRRPELCRTGSYKACWWNALTFARSEDGGRTFIEPVPPGHVVAALPYPYEGDVGRPVGYFSPSNIVEHEGFAYAAFFAESYRRQRRGVCIMRTATPDDPGSWRAWNGEAFAARLDGRAPGTGSDADAVCMPVSPGRLASTLWTIVEHRPTGLFIGLTALVSGPASEPAGIYVTTSRDLLDWSEPRLVWAAPLMFAFDCGAAAVYAYPALIDAKSDDLSFATVGADANLYLTRFNLSGCRLGQDRDLVHIPVEIVVED